MRQQILQLREQGKSYREIQEIIGCSKSTIAYHCNPEVRKKHIKAQTNRRRDNKLKLLAYKGGKCEKCGYDKCIAALEFHHLDPNEKDFEVSHINKSLEDLKKEVDKCILVCSNCHREIHYLEE